MIPLDAAACRRLMGELAQVLEQGLLWSGGALPLLPSVPSATRPPRTPVFAGGAVLSLLITDPASRPREFTKDVDIIVEVLTRRDQMGFAMMLNEAGFTQPLDPNWPQVAWLWKGFRVDFMHCSPNPEIGFGNLSGALATAEPHLLETDVWIWRVSAPGFIGMKFAAFADRGGGRFSGKDASQDAQDIVAVLNGRQEFEADLEHTLPLLRRELAARAASWLIDNAFLEALPQLAEPGREELILRRLRLMAGWIG
jgi:hypothetical protein